MELKDAKKASALISQREALLRMRADAISNNKMRGWSFMVDDTKYPIPSEIKGIFLEAIEKSIDYYEAEIEKL
ncbi:MAG: hypothetical protein HDS84_01235 [Bacteroidales bacterium]|nr:hypothetical protein [Bacteroidales bacterium]